MAVAAIGNPDNFFQLLKKYGLTVEKKLIYPDHYRFTKSEMKNIIIDAKNNDNQIIMTEKDYYKVKDFKLNKIKYLKVSLEIKNKRKLLKIITTQYDKNN